MSKIIKTTEGDAHFRLKEEYLDEQNLVLACSKCNQEKGGKLTYKEYIKFKKSD